ncbi:MAG: hypothetical protein ACK42Z_02100 [Candidatus Kapaibacteriota bacterium]
MCGLGARRFSEALRHTDSFIHSFIHSFTYECSYVIIVIPHGIVYPIEFPKIIDLFHPIKKLCSSCRGPPAK